MLSEESWITAWWQTWWCAVWQTFVWSLGLVRDGGSLGYARYILLGASFAPLSTASEERECGALPRIIVYQHAMCAANLITWWMLTYSLMPILHTTRRPGLRVLSPHLPLLSSRLVVPSRWCTAIPGLLCASGMVKTPDAMLFMALPEQDALDNDIYLSRVLI